MAGWLASSLLLVVVVATDVWVYVDARQWASEGSPVFLRIGGFSIETPVAWFGCCLVLWIVFFPMYLACRNR